MGGNRGKWNDLGKQGTLRHAEGVSMKGNACNNARWYVQYFLFLMNTMQLYSYVQM